MSVTTKSVKVFNTYACNIRLTTMYSNNNNKDITFDSHVTVSWNGQESKNSHTCKLRRRLYDRKIYLEVKTCYK